jgi:hypothetical protein
MHCVWHSSTLLQKGHCHLRIKHLNSCNWFIKIWIITPQILKAVQWETDSNLHLVRKFKVILLNTNFHKLGTFPAAVLYPSKDSGAENRWSASSSAWTPSGNISRWSSRKGWTVADALLPDRCKNSQWVQAWVSNHEFMELFKLPGLLVQEHYSDYME